VRELQPSGIACVVMVAAAGGASGELCRGGGPRAGDDNGRRRDMTRPRRRAAYATPADRNAELEHD
jgi:hypothetical protein